MQPNPFSETVLHIIRTRGVFSINPLQYRNDRKMKVLKKMCKDGLLSRQRLRPDTSLYYEVRRDAT